MTWCLILLETWCHFLQVAAAFTKSALNKTATFPQLTINGMVHYSDPLDSSRQPQAGTQDVNFLYSLAWVDLTGGPLVLTVPASSGRFFELQFVDVYNEVPLLIGVDFTDISVPRWWR